LEAILNREAEQSHFGSFGRVLEHEAVLFHTWHNPLGLVSKGATWGDAAALTPTGLHAVVSNMSCLAPFETIVEPLSSPLIPTPVMMTLAPTDTQKSNLCHIKFALCLRSLLRPSLALSPSEFTTCMRALVSSPVPVSLGQSGSRPGQPALLITGLTTRVFRRLCGLSCSCDM